MNEKEQASGSIAVVCNGQRHMDNFMMNKVSSITETVNGAWDFSL